MELYVLGRPLVDVFPLAPLARRQALCIAIMSYHGKLNFGLLGDFDAMADLEVLARASATRSTSYVRRPASAGGAAAAPRAAGPPSAARSNGSNGSAASRAHPPEPASHPRRFSGNRCPSG